MVSGVAPLPLIVKLSVLTAVPVLVKLTHVLLVAQAKSTVPEPVKLSVPNAPALPAVLA